MNITLSDSQKRIYVYYIHLLSSAINSVKPQEPPEDFNWELVTKHAMRNSVLNLLAYSVKNIKNKPDESILKVMENERRVAILKETSQLFDIEKVLQKFDDAGICNIPLKGYFIKHLYPQSDFRTMTDVDIFVNKKDFKTATKIFTDLGFTQPAVIKADELHFQKDLLYVELQSNINDGDDTYFDDVFNKTILRDDYNYSYKLSDEDFYIYMVYHCAHHFKTGGIGIRMLMDIYVFLSQHNDLDFNYIDNSLKELNLVDFETQIKSLSINWFSYNETKITPLGEFVLYCSTYGTRDIYFYQESKRQGKGFAIKQIFIPYSKMKNTYGYLRKAPFLLPFAWTQYWFTRLFVHRNINLKQGIRSRTAVSEQNAEFVSKIMQELNI